MHLQEGGPQKTFSGQEDQTDLNMWKQNTFEKESACGVSSEYK